MAGFNPKWIVGKTVERIESRPFNAGGEGRGIIAHDPHIFFTDGSSIRFVTEETETGEYGTEIVYQRALAHPSHQAASAAGTNKTSSKEAGEP